MPFITVLPAGYKRCSPLLHHSHSGPGYHGPRNPLCLQLGYQTDTDGKLIEKHHQQHHKGRGTTRFLRSERWTLQYFISKYPLQQKRYNKKYTVYLEEIWATHFSRNFLIIIKLELNINKSVQQNTIPEASVCKQIYKEVCYLSSQ